MIAARPLSIFVPGVPGHVDGVRVCRGVSCKGGIMVVLLWLYANPIYIAPSGPYCRMGWIAVSNRIRIPHPHPQHMQSNCRSACGCEMRMRYQLRQNFQTLSNF